MNIYKEMGFANSGCVNAQEHLAWLYYKGEGVKKSHKKSFYWSCKAAISGESPISSFNVSISYFNGEGVAQNDYKAFLWAKRSAKQGVAEGCFATGVHYLYGYGVRQNIHNAIYYLTKAYRMNPSTDAAKLLGEIYYSGDKVRKSYREAFYWVSCAALHSKNSTAFNELSLYYLNGVGVRKNYRKAFLWAKKSAKDRDVDGMLAVGWHYLNGLGIPQSTDLAKYWFNKIITMPILCSSAFYNLGYIHYYEYHDYKTAYEYFLKAYNIDHHITSAYMMARIFATGVSIPMNMHNANRLLKYAASKGNYHAQRLLSSKHWNALKRRKKVPPCQS